MRRVAFEEGGRTKEEGEMIQSYWRQDNIQKYK
jgi:hypothetical protein